MMTISARIAHELGVRVPQVDAAIALLDDKSTVPFIARYRKEATGGLDDTQLRSTNVCATCASSTSAAPRS
jgi:protein Tex